jgi:hypothetical protein
MTSGIMGMADYVLMFRLLVYNCLVDFPDHQAIGQRGIEDLYQSVCF